MKKLSLIVAAAMATGMFSAAVSAETVNTNGMSAEGLTTYSYDFEKDKVNSTYSLIFISHYALTSLSNFFINISPSTFVSIENH